ncbi:CHASE2 domain-containing protein [Leptothoe kymatousa]|uniref:CHASE2 domain-containing protein n=1 Tax=Leptothoe kymatousa TAU-MAC 1615 TaxID=2364775 RepID=A0ABS5Y2K5_9CYAN|nr:CHASE2 domain-containing protein [Leptothoe kymatousa]MBT9312047.1 CHASE2 domain-containing protein [Leptothoe kymatousa TAU-MAC 1615]
MNSLVILNLGKGNCYDGLPHITARLVRQHEAASQMQYTGSLPSVPEIPKLYNHWQQLYKALHKALRKRLSTRSSIEFDDTVPTNVSEEEFRYLGEQLQKHINKWLNSSGFRTIDQQLRTQLDPKETIRFIIETEDPFLQKLPWHLWCFFEHYQKAEIAISAKNYQQVPAVPNSRVSRQMRILVVLGHSDGIDVQLDRGLLEDSAAETLVLNEPRRSVLEKHLRDKVGWDIFFFAGHSTSQAIDTMGEVRDQLSLNSCENLSISEVKYAFKDAIDKGLKLAIFNSCDGLGLARQLVDLNLPQLIAMREPVLDQVAHAFLKHFLQDFARGGPFYASVRYARERLQGMETDYPGASWLPIIYQNPTEGSFVWRTLQPPIPVAPQRRISDRKITAVNLRNLLLPVMLAMVLMVTGLRSLGWLQSAELGSYDALVRSRPVGADISEIDDRLLVVEITAEDTDKYTYPIHDDRLAEALTKLRQHDPVAIGVDLHRYQANGEGREQLLQQFEEFPDLITVCSFGFGDRELLSHPPEFSLEQAQNQVGFSDLETDALFQPGKSVVRRQLLSYDVNLAEESSDCVTSYSFGLNLALRYLLTHGVQPLRANGSNWLLGDVEFKRLSAQTGAYQALDGQINQMLLNYRFRPKPAIRASLEDVLAEKVADNEIRDRIVLIGVVDPFGGDLRHTPFGELPGVWIHTHAVSNILSAVLDQRSLLWVLPQWGRFQWGDLLWLWLWAGVGGLLVWWVKSLPLLALSLLVACWGLRQLCLFILIQGGWVPLIPALLALVGTAVILLARKHGFLPLESLSEQLNIKRHR